MKITVVMGFFLPVPPAAGGATEKSWHRLAIEFARRGHEVTVISRQWPDWPAEEIRDGVRHVRPPGFPHTSSLPINLLRDARWSLRVWRRLPPADVTVINCLTLPLLLGSSRRQTRHVVLMCGRIPKGQFRLYRHIDRVLAVSSEVLECIRAENPRLAQNAIVTGYPIDWQQLSPPRAPEPTPLTLGYVGRVHREKGLDLLADAARELAADPTLPPCRILICGPSDVARGGSGPEYVRGLQRTFGAVADRLPVAFREPTFDSTALADTYRGIDVFCYPSISASGETFGVAVAEAMASGAVPVVSALPCFSDYLQAGVNGCVFDHRAPDAAQQLANTIVPLLRDATLRRRLAAAARESVHRFDVPDYAGRLLADFSTLK